MLIVASMMEKVKNLKTSLSKKFDMNNLDAVKKILRMETHRDKVSKKSWLTKVLDRFSMENEKLVNYSLVNHFCLFF